MNILRLLPILILGFIAGRMITPENKQAEQLSPAVSITKFTDLPELTGNEVSFSRLILETRQLKIIPFDGASDIHLAIKKTIMEAAEECRVEFSASNSPLHGLSRINEASRFFEDRLLVKINAQADFRCSIPLTSDGREQRSGYPDLRVEHLPSKTVAYLDPKLFAEKSIDSSFRTFYYEPTEDNGKITENALHLLLGFPHNSKSGAWTFSKVHLIDLSDLEVTLKAEFHASNRDLYAGDMELDVE